MSLGRLVRRVGPMRRGQSYWLAVCLVLAASGAQAQPVYRFAPPADWIDVADPESSSVSPGNHGESIETLLLDRQVNVTVAGDEFYQRLVTRVLNPVGVDEYSQIDFVVDPTFQSLDIHWLTIVRNGVTVDQRTTARITELAQETDLRNRIYNGRYTVNVLLSDVRPGDVVDYAYSIRSRENLFPGHFYARFDLRWSTPVAWVRTRILSPVGRRLRYRSSDATPLPAPVARGSVSEFMIESRNLPGVAADGAAPSWYSAWPYLEIGDLQDWREAARRVDALYRNQPRGGALVDEIVTSIRSAGGSPEEQALRALHWVQQEIRYTSISIGRGSHEPTEPNAVIERRYGDCKDKSLLLVTVLGALGIEADVALVHSWLGRTLADTLPSPYAFDHVIVRAKVGAAVHWLDPTNLPQQGPLDVDRSPNFAHALVLADDVDGLAVIPKPGADVRLREIDVVLDARKGVEAAATLDITTRYRHALADTMRSLFSGGTAEQWQTDYSQYIARYYPTAKTREPLEFDDDLDGNVLEVRERYSLDAAFTANEQGVLELVIHPDELYRYGEPLGAGNRQAPLSLEYPIHVRQGIVVLLPEPWLVTEERQSVENPAFRYLSAVRYSANRLTLGYDYQSLDDHVPVAALARYEADRARMYDDLGYSLTYNTALASGLPTAVAPVPMTVLLLVLVGSIWAAVTLGYRYDPEPGFADDAAPVGIAGWLLLPALGAIVSPLILGWSAAQWLPFIGAEQWSMVPTLVAPPYASTAQSVILAAVSFNVAFLVASILLLWLFMTKRTSAPAVYIASQWTGLAIFTGFLAWTLASGLDEETEAALLFGETLRDTLGAAIWTAYLLSSRRVKATFVGRWRHGSATVA